MNIHIDNDEYEIPLGNGLTAPTTNNLKGDFDWRHGELKCEFLYMQAHTDGEWGEWVRIDDIPSFQIFVEAAEIYAADLHDRSSENLVDPNAEHRLTSRELGVGAFA